MPHIWGCHVTHVLGLKYIKHNLHFQMSWLESESCHTNEKVMPHIELCWKCVMSRTTDASKHLRCDVHIMYSSWLVSHGKKSCHTYEWVMSSERLSKPCHRWHEWMSVSYVVHDSRRMRRSHVARMNKSCHTNDWVGHVTITRMNACFVWSSWLTLHGKEPCHTYERVMLHEGMSRTCHTAYASKCHWCESESCLKHGRVMSRM